MGVVKIAERKIVFGEKSRAFYSRQIIGEKEGTPQNYCQLIHEPKYQVVKHFQIVMFSRQREDSKIKSYRSNVNIVNHKSSLRTFFRT